MNSLKEISRLNYYHDGGTKIFGKEIPYTRTWTLEGYDSNDNLICQVTESEENNYLKYVRFIQKLKKNNYKLRKDDREELKNERNEFLFKSLVSKATKKDLYAIASIAGYSKNEVNLIQDLPDDKKKEFAEEVGLEYNELLQVINKW